MCQKQVGKNGIFVKISKILPTFSHLLSLLSASEAVSLVSKPEFLILA
jgi:hypothetical protein